MVFVLPEIPPAETKLRSHPWARNADESGGYYDFVAHPELIPQVLEDYRPFDAQPAVHLFYDMLGWINGPESLLETNDCALVFSPKRSQWEC